LKVDLIFLRIYLFKSEENSIIRKILKNPIQTQKSPLTGTKQEQKNGDLKK